MPYCSAKEVLEALEHAYFEERNIEKVLSCVTEDIEWIGTELSEHASGKAAVFQTVTESLKKIPATLTPIFSAPNETAAGESVRLLTFTGTYLETPEIPYHFHIRASVCCVKTACGWLIQALHFSVPNIGREVFSLKQKLSKTEERRRVLQDSIPGGTAIYRIKKDGRVETEFVSESFAKICGYDGAEELLERARNNAKTEIPDDEWDKLFSQVLASLRSGEPISAKYHVYAKDRKKLLVNMNANVISDEALADDEVAVLYAVHTLPTAREIREQSYYRTIMDMMGIAYWEWTKENGFYSTKDYQKYALSQRPLEDIKNNRVFDDAIHPEDIEKLKFFFAKGDDRQNRAAVTIRLKLLDGGYHWTQIFGFKEFSEAGETVRMSCVMRDVDAEYGHSVMMSNLLNAMPGGVGIFVFGETLGCEFYSDGFARLAGISRKEMDQKLADNTVLSSMIAPEDYQEVAAALAERTPKGLPLNMSYRYLYQDGSIRWLHLTAEKMGDRNGYPAYYCVFTTPTEEAALYQTISEDSANGIAIFTFSERRNIYINSAAVKFYGLGSIGDIAGKSIVKTMEAHNLPLLLTREEVDSIGANQYTTFHVERRGRYLAVKGKRMDWGGIDAYVLYLSDETAEHNKELQLEKMLNDIPTGIATYRIDANEIKQTFANNGFYKILNVSQEEYEPFFGQNLFGALSQTDRQKADQIVEALRTGRDEFDLTVCAATPGHPKIWIRLVGSVSERISDEFTVYVGITDVTAQIEAQNRQKELFDTIPSGILEFFYDGHCLKTLSANQTLLDMIGYTGEEYCRKSKWSVADVVYPEDRHLLIEAHNSVAIGKGMTYDFRLLNKKTGTYRWVSCDFTITERSAAGVKVISAFLDIDDKRKLEDASAAKSRFLSRMSHEIRTPINAIMGIAELERQDIERGDVSADSIRRYSQETFAASEYLLTLVNDILDTSRIENNQIEIQQRPINAEQYLADIKALIEPLIKEKNIHFSCERKTSFHNAYIGDGVRVKQILINLLNNAFKFTPAGGSVQLICEAVADTGKTTTLQFTVSDTGIGMSKEFQKTMFLPFAQENGDTTSPFSGTGLGLGIAKSLAQKMGGDIICRSEKGKGTTFVVTIVVGIATDEEANEIAAAENEGEGEEFDFGGIRILVCEDHPLNQKITKALLERRKCVVEIAADGMMAVDMFEKSAPGYYSAILMDIRMPNMDGLQATRKIRGLDRTDARAIPIVAMSANAYEEDVQKSLAAGMNGHLAKPVDAAKLYRSIAHFTMGPEPHSRN